LYARVAKLVDAAVFKTDIRPGYLRVRVPPRAPKMLSNQPIGSHQRLGWLPSWLKTAERPLSPRPGAESADRGSQAPDKEGTAHGPPLPNPAWTGSVQRQAVQFRRLG